MDKRLRVLMVEDVEDDALLIIQELRGGGYRPEWERVDTAADMAAALNDKPWDIVIADYTMPHFSATEALALLKKKSLDLPLIIVSGTIGEETAVAALKAGAHDYFIKGNLIRLAPAVEREINEAEERRERRRAQRALRESEAKYRDMVENISDVIYAVDMDGLVTYASPAIEHFLGFEASALIGRHFTDYVYPEDVPRTSAHFRITLSGVPQTNEYRLLSQAGEVHWARVSGRPILEGDRIIGARGVLSDITERKNAVSALEYRFELEQLITSISTHFINLPSDEIDSGINSALRRIGEFAGVDRSYVFLLRDGGKKMDNTHEWCADGIEPHIQRLKGLSTGAFAWLMSSIKSGKELYVPRVADVPSEAATEKKEWELEGIQSLICVPMLYGGQVTGFAGFDSVRAEKTWADDTIALLKIVGEIFSNAQERKRAEEALRESEARYRGLSERLEETVKKKVAELEQAEKLAAIGRMVSTVAHEVRNPLQNIQLGIDAMHQEMRDNEDVAEILEGIDYGVNLLNGIITELLEYSRPVKLQYSSVSIRDLIEQALKTQAQRLDGINTRLELDRDDRSISIDAAKFSTVLVNLIVNAVEAMPGGGDLTIRSRFHGTNDEGGAGALRLSVSDTGCGIGGEHLKRVGEPFFTTKTTGTGLGLPVCKKIIEAHGGSLTIRSKPNEGTTVEILLPPNNS